MKLSNDDIAGILDREITVAKGHDTDALSDRRTQAYNYYFGKMEAAPKGRSQVVSFDVADTIHAIMAQAGEIFRSSGVEFDATSEEDEPQAQLESDFIQRMFESKDEYATFDAAVFDALLQANGWIYIDVEEEVDVHRESFKQIPPESLAMMIEDAEQRGLTVEITKIEDNTDDGSLIDADIKMTKVERELTVECVAPDSIIYSPSSDQFDVQGIRFIARRQYMTGAELKEAGLSDEEIKQVPAITDDYWTSTAAREEGEVQHSLDGEQDAATLRETFVCYPLLDMDGSGALERRRVHIAGKQIISNEPVEWVPFVTGSPLPVSHRISGQGMYDIMHGIQKTKTGVLRAYMDNLNVGLRGRVGYLRGEVDTDALLDGRLNTPVSMDRPDAVFPFPTTDVGGIAMQGLAYLDSQRTSRGGAALDLTSGEMQVAGSSAMAAGREYESKEKMAGLYCKNLAHSLLKSAFLMAHRTLRKHFTEPMGAKLKGKWVQTTPSEWPERKHALLHAGLTRTEKANKLAGLAALIDKQERWILNGQEGVLTDKAKLYAACSDWIKASDIGGNPEEFISDPTSENAQKIMQQAQQQQAQQAQAEREDAQRILQVQQEVERVKSETQKEIARLKTDFDYYRVNQDMEVKEAELTLRGLEMREGSTADEA